jgi:hypothetical protein
MFEIQSRKVLAQLKKSEVHGWLVQEAMRALEEQTSR